MGRSSQKRRKRYDFDLANFYFHLDTDIDAVESLNSWEKTILKEVDPNYEISDDENAPPREEEPEPEPVKGKGKKK